MGANVDEMDAPHHDLVLAVDSHTPHLIAYTMVGVADDLRRVTNSEVIKYSAAGFRDFTRIAASDPTMWRDVFLTNKDATLDILGRFTEELFALQRAIRWAMVRTCMPISPGLARSGAVSSRPGRIPRRPTLAGQPEQGPRRNRGNSRCARSRRLQRYWRFAAGLRWPTLRPLRSARSCDLLPQPKPRSPRRLRRLPVP